MKFTLAFCGLAFSISMVVSLEMRVGVVDRRVPMETTNENETASLQNAIVNCKSYMKHAPEHIIL